MYLLGTLAIVKVYGIIGFMDNKIGTHKYNIPGSLWLQPKLNYRLLREC